MPLLRIQYFVLHGCATCSMCKKNIQLASRTALCIPPPKSCHPSSTRLLQVLCTLSAEHLLIPAHSCGTSAKHPVRISSRVLHSVESCGCPCILHGGNSLHSRKVCRFDWRPLASITICSHHINTPEMGSQRAAASNACLTLGPSSATTSKLCAHATENPPLCPLLSMCRAGKNEEQSPASY